MGASNFKIGLHQFNLRLHHFSQFPSNVSKKKVFKSWQVYDWLAKWLIMSGYMDLRRPRVYRRSNVGLVSSSSSSSCSSSSSSSGSGSSSSSSSNFTPNRIQQNNTVCMINTTNRRVIVDIVMWFCWWPPEKPWAYQAGSHIFIWIDLW